MRKNKESNAKNCVQIGSRSEGQIDSSKYWLKNEWPKFFSHILFQREENESIFYTERNLSTIIQYLIVDDT